MIKVGITGQNGFIGTSLYNFLGLFPNEFERVSFERDFFDNKKQIIDFVSKCDVIVHLAGMNRHQDEQVIYDTNLDLTERLITVLKETGSKAHVLFSSSTQEEDENLYGLSKRESRNLLNNWAKSAGGTFTGLLIPNVFGPFGKPYYNSFISTFCYRLTHGEQPEVNIDKSVKLIYVDELAGTIIDHIRAKTNQELVVVVPTADYKVTEILLLLEGFKQQYLISGIIPMLNNRFEINLFNTFRSYIAASDHYPVKFVQHADNRGVFVEIIKLNTGGQISFSTTRPGITRGNHFHTRKIERFAVIKGEALIQLRQIGTENTLNFKLSGNEPAYVDMPVWYTHNIKNIGEEELYTIFWINEFFNPDDADTYFETV